MGARDCFTIVLAHLRRALVLEGGAAVAAARALQLDRADAGARAEGERKVELSDEDVVRDVRVVVDEERDALRVVVVAAHAHDVLAAEERSWVERPGIRPVVLGRRSAAV